MKTSMTWSPAAGLNVVSVERGEQAWTITVDSQQSTVCPGCGARSGSRHSTYWRTLRDLSAQGAPVIVNARLGRWRCRNRLCDRRIFTERVPGLASPFARRTARLAEIVRLIGHSAGGRPSERLMRRLGMPVSDTTILAGLKKHARGRSEGSAAAAVRVAGVDDWAWRKGHKYGTIIVDLERRAVVDVLPDRSAVTTGRWFKDHPNVEVVSRDRAGLYAEAAREGAPQAKQVADRFHLMQNFRETVERQLGGYEAPIRDSRFSDNGIQALPALPARSDRRSDAAAQTRLIRRERQAARQQIFDEIKALFEGGNSIREIARKLGLGRRRVERWVRRIDVPDRNTTASTPSSPAYFGILLERRWAEGITKVRHLFDEIHRRGYTGSFSHLARFLAPWRSGAPSLDDDEQEAPLPVRVRTLDPMTGRLISPLTAAALCVKPRGQMTPRQAASVDALKSASAEFTTMRRLAMRFRGLLRGGTAEGLDAWLIDARASGIYAMQRFAKTIRQDLEAVRNAVSGPWSNGQTEGLCCKDSDFAS
jgi:transposase/transposase-like protein